MSLQKPDIVIFDMDGTTVRHINPRMLHVLEWLDDMAFGLVRLKDWLFERKAHGPIVPDWESYKSRRKPKLLVHRVLHRFRKQDVQQIVEPCPGIYAVLDFLRAHKVPMALASNGLGKGYGHDVLRTFDLEQYFGATIFREDIKKSKPNPEGILLALNRLGAPHGSGKTVWHIGDRHKDVRAVLAARTRLECDITPIAYGLNAAVAVLEKQLGPEHIIMSYFDMLTTLEKIMGKPPACEAKNSSAIPCEEQQTRSKPASEKTAAGNR